MQQPKQTCRNCKYCYRDNRIADYRRGEMFFCRKKGAFFSRNYRVGEGTRIHGNDIACGQFVKTSDAQE